MIIQKIEFADAVYHTIVKPIADPAWPVATVYKDDIISFTAPKEQLVGVAIQEYTIQSWNITIRYNALLDTYVYDAYGLPSPLDEFRILNYYMVYIYYRLNDTDSELLVYPAYILYDTNDVNVLNNTFKFEAVHMIGVIAKYAKQKPYTIDVEGNEIYVPRSININQDLYNYYTTTAQYAFLPFIVDPQQYTIFDYVPSLSSLWNTCILNIFTNNNAQYYTYAWQNTTDWNKVYAKSMINNNGNNFNLLDVGSDTFFTTPIRYDICQTPFTSWRDEVASYLGVNFDTVIAPYLYNYKALTTLITYQQRVGIAFIPVQGQLEPIGHPSHYVDGPGYVFTDIIDILDDLGWFGDVSPLIIYTNAEPDPLPSSSVPIIGISIQPPAWVIANGNIYYWRRPQYDDITRIIALQYWIYGARNAASGTVRQIFRRNVYRLNTTKPSIIEEQFDTGFVKHPHLRNYYQYDFTPGAANPVTATYTTYPDPFLTVFSADQSFMLNGLYSHIDNSYISCQHQYGRLTSILQVMGNVQYQEPKLVGDPNDLQSDVQIYMPQLLSQLITYKGRSLALDSTNRAAAFSKFIYDDISVLNDSVFYDIDNNDIIEDYKYMHIIKPQIPEDMTSILKYNRPKNIRYRRFIQTLYNNYNIKVSIKLIGIISELDLIDNRFFIFQNGRYQLTSIKYENNSTLIEGYGKR